MRFFSHLTGCSIAFYKTNDEKAFKLVNSLITSTCFPGLYQGLSSRGALPSQFDHVYPLFIQYGKDSFESIGDPRIQGGKTKELVGLWEEGFFTLFKKPDQSNDSTFDEIGLKKKYPEDRIDSELRSFE